LLDKGSPRGRATAGPETTMKRSYLICLTLLLAACQKAPPAEPELSALALQGHAFAQESCAQCHAIDRDGISRNSNAPPFPAIANQKGVSRETLTPWLRGAHNYPREMDFYLVEDNADALVAYLLTLKDPNYRRPPD
jgi:mono/diheme cytochrome c family protein